MKSFLFLSIAFALICANLASIYRIEDASHKDYPNQCYIEEQKRAYTVGVHRPEGECHEILCHSDLSLQRHDCGLVMPGKGYHNEIDFTQPYPKCCVNIVKDI